MTRRSLQVSRLNHNPTESSGLAKCGTYQTLARAARTVAPALVALAFAGVAHAQGTMDFSGATTLMGSFNTRFAYVSVSRASQDAQIYTNDAETLGKRLSTDVTKNSAVDVQKVQVEDTAKQHYQEPSTESNLVSENVIVPANFNINHRYDQGLSL